MAWKDNISVESSALGKMPGILTAQYMPMNGCWHSDDEINDEKPAPSTFSQSHRTISKSITKVLTQQDHDIHLWSIISTRSRLLLGWS
jgi:hypothetical protein